MGLPYSSVSFSGSNVSLNGSNVSYSGLIDVDQDPVFPFDTDPAPDLATRNYADPCGPGYRRRP